MPNKTMELRFPAAGVIRRLGHESAADTRTVAHRSDIPTYAAPWAVNVRLLDPIARRLRGGSRCGLTKFLADAVGTTIADMVAIQTASDSGTEEMLVVLVDETVGVVSDGSITTPAAYLEDEDGNYVVTEGGDYISLATSDAPATGFLVVGQQHVYAVGSSRIVKLDPKTGDVDNLTATAGSIPTGCTFGCIYRDCLFLAGGDNVIRKSKQGDYTNWDFSADVSDTRRAMFFQLSAAERVGGLVTAIVPHKDAFLLAATARDLWIVHGDPAGGGSLRRVSDTAGVVSSRAWCKVGDAVMFLAEDGLYRVGADGSDLTNLSGDRLPDELRDVDPATVTVLMEYDHNYRALHLYLATDGGSDTHWLFELDSAAFWPVRLNDDHVPVTTCRYDGDLLLGCSDGYIRSVGGDDDDGETIQSHVLIGPLRLGGPIDFGMLHTLHGAIATGSGSVNWRIVPGETAEEAAVNGKAAVEAFQAGEAYGHYVHSSGSWTAGRSHTYYPRTRAMWACVWLQSTAKWGYEQVNVQAVPSGQWR